MHKVVNRVLNAVALTLVVLGWVVASFVVSTIGNPYKPSSPAVFSAKAILQPRRVQPRRSQDPGQSIDLFHLKLDLDVNLEPFFDWNVKELFVYLVAEYATPDNPLNQVVLWDKIVTSKDSALLSYQNTNAEYLLHSAGANLRGANVSLKLRWNVVPYVGFFFDVLSSQEHQFELPTEVSYQF